MSNIPPPMSPMGPEGYGPKPKSKIPTWVWIVVPIVLCLPCVAILAAVLFPVFSQAREAARVTSAINNTKIVTLGAIMYAGDHDDIGPASVGWEDLIAPYSRNETTMAFPGLLEERQPARIAMNSVAGDLRFSDVEKPDQTIWFFLSNRTEASAVGGAEDLGRLPRGRAVLGFVDGSVKRIGGTVDQPYTWEGKKPRD